MIKIFNGYSVNLKTLELFKVWYVMSHVVIYQLGLKNRYCCMNYRTDTKEMTFINTWWPYKNLLTIIYSIVLYNSHL